MKRAVIVGALVLAAIFSAALITTSREQEPPKIQPREPVQLRDPFRPDHQTRAQRDAEKRKSAPAGAGDNQKER